MIIPIAALRQIVRMVGSLRIGLLLDFMMITRRLPEGQRPQTVVWR